MTTPRKKAHELIAENLKAIKEGKTLPHPDKAQEAQFIQQELEKTEVQQRIMDPDGTEVKLPSYGSITVYPLVMREKRKAGGFVAQVSADAIGGGARSNEELTLRFASLLMRRDDLESELFRLAAVATQKAEDQANTAKILAQVADFQQKCTSEDIIALFGAVTDLAEFKAPKI